MFAIKGKVTDLQPKIPPVHAVGLSFCADLIQIASCWDLDTHTAATESAIPGQSELNLLVSYNIMA